MFVDFVTMFVLFPIDVGVTLVESCCGVCILVVFELIDVISGDVKLSALLFVVAVLLF